MHTPTYLPAGRLQKLLQASWLKLMLGFLMVFLPVAIGQTFLLSLPLTRLWRGLLVVAFTWPIAWGVYALFVQHIERRQNTELALSGALRETAWGVLVGALLFGAIMALLALAGVYEIQGWNDWSVLLAPFLFAASSAVFEEILFRGLLFRLVERSLGSWPALAISAALFGGLHLMNENATITGAVAIMLQAGIAMGGAFMLTRRLWLPIGMHFAWNFAQAGIFGSAVSGNAAGPGLLRSTLTGPDWLTGGVFGVEASLVSVVLCLAAGAAFLWLASRRHKFLPHRPVSTGRPIP